MKIRASYYKSFFEFIQTEYGEQDDFTKFFQKILPFILLVRNIRNCLDHRKTETEIKEIELQINANIISPTIEVNYLDSKMQRTSIAEFLPIVTQNLVMIFETTIAYLCSKQSKPNKIFPGQVMLIPEERRIKISDTPTGHLWVKEDTFINKMFQVILSNDSYKNDKPKRN